MDITRSTADAVSPVSVAAAATGVSAATTDCSSMSAVGVNVALYQGQAVRGDVAANLTIVEAVVKECQLKKVDLVLFPELFATGYDCDEEEFQALAFDPAEDLKYFSELARDTGVAIAIGYPELGGSVLYNSCVLIDASGNVCLNYRKTHLWDPEMVHEKKIFATGDCLPVTKLTIPRLGTAVTIGILVCFDCEFPEPARALALQGVEILLIPTAIADVASNVTDPSKPGDLTPTIIVPCRAMENHIFALYANLIGPCSLASSPSKPNPIFCGQSCIVGPDGKDLARATRTESKLLIACLNKEPYLEGIRRNNYLVNRRPELYISAMASTGPGTPKASAEQVSGISDQTNCILC
jgi:predicted amidohydrolase